MAAGLAGCRGAASRTDIQATYDPKTGKLTRLTSDANGNGAPDTWAYMDGARVLRIESDENEDGRIDRWEYHRASGGDLDRPDRTLERIEKSTRRDGKVSRWEYFAGGVLTHAEEDTTGNGKIDKWETYTAGVLTTIALDTQGTGKPDRRLIYRADGSFDRIDVDPTGAGAFEPLKP